MFQIPLQTIFPDGTLPRNIYINFPFPRMSDNVRSHWNVRDNRRRPMRCFPSIVEMRNSIRRATQEMCEACEEFDDARADFQEAKMRMEESKNEITNIKTGLQNSTNKLERLMNNFQSPRMLNNLNVRDRNTFQRELETVRHDIDEAKCRIREANVELEEDGSAYATQNREQNAANRGIKRLRTDTADAEPGGSNNNNNNDKTDKSEGANSCSVCMENPVNAVLYTCGHMCMCFSCSRKLQRRRGDNRRCPMCRAVIRDVIKIFKS